MKLKLVLFLLITILIVCCKKDVSTTIKGNWYFLDITEGIGFDYNEVFFTDSLVDLYLEIIGNSPYRNYIIRNDSLVIGQNEEDQWKFKIKFINENQFKTYSEFGISIYHRIVGNQFTLDSINSSDNYYKYQDAFIERKYIQYKKANIFYYDDYFYDDDDVYIIEEETFPPNYEKKKESIIIGYKKDVSNTIKGNWYFFDIIEDKIIYYNEVYFDDSKLFLHLDGSMGDRHYFIRNDSLIQIDRIKGEEIRPSKIKIINKNRFKTYNEFGGIAVYHRIVGNQFTLDSIKSDDDKIKYLESFKERKQFQFKKAGINTDEYIYEYEYDYEVLIDEERVEFGMSKQDVIQIKGEPYDKRLCPFDKRDSIYIYYTVYGNYEGIQFDFRTGKVNGFTMFGKELNEMEL